MRVCVVSYGSCEHCVDARYSLLLTRVLFFFFFHVFIRRCEVFQLHPELVASEQELINEIKRLTVECRPLLPQLTSSKGAARAEVAKKLQRISAACAQLDTAFRSRFSLSALMIASADMFIHPRALQRASSHCSHSR